VGNLGLLGLAFAPLDPVRRVGPGAAGGGGFPTSGQDQRAREIRYTRREAGPSEPSARKRSTATAYSTGAAPDPDGAVATASVGTGPRGRVVASVRMAPSEHVSQ
jgi:hypothetical protein